MNDMKFDKVIKNSIATSEEKSLVAETARINLKNGADSEFPADAYRVWVQREKLLGETAQMYIQSFKERWIVEVNIEDGQLWNVISYGNRERKDMFIDVIRMVQSWLKRQTLMPGRIGTNQEAAMNEWEACNS